MKTAAIVLAGDDSQGFQGSKYLSEFRGSTLIELVVSEVHEWPVDTVVVVLGAAANEILERADLGDSVVVVDLEPNGVRWRDCGSALTRCTGSTSTTPPS